MLLAPLTCTEPSAHRGAPPPRRAARASRARGSLAMSAPAQRAPAWLVAWLAAGVILLACVPALRGSAASGASWPFWLVGAPLLDLAWLRRAALLRALARAAAGARLRSHARISARHR